MIIYFSGTGNSRYAAQMFGEQLQDQVIDAGQWIKKGQRGEFESERPWVFVSPTYAWQLPHIFEKFIREATLKGAKAAYFIMTCGGDIGNAEAPIIKLCSQVGLEYRGVFEIVMPENYIAMFKVPDKEKSESIIREAIPVMQKGIQVIREEGILQHRKATMIDKLKSGIINWGFYRFSVKAKKFEVKDQCISCGKCVKDCPLNNIQLVSGLPSWGSNCTHCMACICGCPKEAIEYGKASIGQPRYQCKAYNK